jgi:hypothetical protein
MSQAAKAHITTPFQGKSLYPKYFVTPSGRRTSIRTMALALKRCRQEPDREFTGWEWFEVSGRVIARQFMAGLHDRINRRVLA